MEFRVLGPLEVVHEGREVPLGGGRERALLALLLLSANRVLSSERLADDLWAGRPPEGAHQAIQVYVSRLRKALRQGGGDEVLLTRSPGYLAHIDPADLDASRFEALLAEGRARAAAGDHGRAAATLQEALGLWRGPVLADLADAPFARSEAARLEEARLAATEERIESDLAGGRHRELIPELDALTREHPLRERFWAQRMVALYRAGRQAEALRVYQELRGLLASELGLEPSTALRRLEGAILRHDPELDRPATGTTPEGVVTILFTDLVGSTELLDRLGEEAAEALRRTHFFVLRHAVSQTGGEEVKSLGDGLMVVFASPLAALGCAVAIQRGVAEHNRANPGSPLAVRVGLQAGEATRAENDFFGTAVVVAKRLCDSAEAGQILAGEVVASLVGSRGDFHLRPLGPLALKGLAAPVPAVALAWQRPGDAEADAAAGGLGELPLPPFLTARGRRFVGREGELDRLQLAWKETQAGHHRVVLVGGEPGVGKTRLAVAFAEEVHALGAVVLAGRCDEDLSVPYQPVVEALGHFLDHTPPEVVRPSLGRLGGELGRLVPELPDRVPGLAPPLRSDPETERYRLFDAVAAWLGAASVERPLLLVFDDLHWAPRPTLLLLRHVVRSAGPGRILIVGTYRDTELGTGHPLSELLADLRRDEGVERLALSGLEVAEVVAVLEQAAGHSLDDEELTLARAVHAETEGNPFFVWEMVRHFAEIGALVRRQGRWFAGRPVTELGIPEGVRDVVGRRLSRLSETANGVLTAAAVIGIEFDLVTLRALGGPDDGELVVALDDAVAARLVQERGTGAYRFVHALVRSTLYDAISTTRRAQLHLAVADALEATGGDDPVRVAHHLLAAGPLADATRTARVCLAAGDRALAALADAEAHDWFARGFPLASAEHDPGLHMDLLTGLGQAQRRLGDTAASRRSLLDAARLAADHRDQERLVRAVLANNRLYVGSIGQVDEEYLDLIGAALGLVGSSARAERAELLALQAAQMLFTDDREGRLRAADEAAAIAAQLGDPDLRAWVGVRRFTACLVPERAAVMAAEGLELVGLADTTGDPQLRVWARALTGHALFLTGELHRALPLAGEGMAIADETGEPGLRCIAHCFYGAALEAVGEHDEGRRLIDAFPELGLQAGWPDVMIWYLPPMGTDALWRGQKDVLEGLPGLLPALVAEYPAFSVLVRAVEPFFLAPLGHRDEELAECLAAVPSFLPDLPVDWLWLAGHCWLTLGMAFGVEDRAAAASVYDNLLPYRSLHAGGGCTVYIFPIEAALAITARVMGEPETALAHHEAAAAAIEASGGARARALNGYQWARTLLARNAPGDRPEAAALLQETLEYSRTKGYAFLVEKCEELLASTR